MSFQVTLQPSGHVFSTAADQTLLEAALDAGINVPYGCRNGACGACKGKITEGQVDHGHFQENALPADQRAAGVTLFCCAKARSDLTIECKEVAGAGQIAAKILPCRVQKLERLAPDVIALYLQLPANERLQFLAGQFIEFLLKDGKRRAYSIANAPHADSLLEVHIRLVPGGLFTEQVFNTMKEKDILRFEGPHGSFTLREDSDKPIILLAGGTGFAPVKSIVEHAIHNKIQRPMTIYWGSRDRAGLYMDALPRQWAAEHPHIRYVPVLSDPTAADAWEGRTGLVHQAVLDDFPDAPGAMKDVQVYACGAPVMIEAAQRDFAARGLPAEEFFADAFTFAPPGQ
ncbi:MAG: CDP-6-deoxy-delta-3,4-glucoseen reductase [Rhodocyclaceae bacterium]|nr:CDP-6-deoxy-delta-3,4-glucoseen reductase [Rhodocyclaceae bacterium]